jgi:hypothetical protein
MAAVLVAAAFVGTAITADPEENPGSPPTTRPTAELLPFDELPVPVRIGAICSDGWRSSATGSGACSHHGGVARWVLDDGTLRPSTP